MSLASAVKSLGPFSRVLGVSRGGAIPAVTLAHILEIMTVRYVHLNTYDDSVTSRLQNADDVEAFFAVSEPIPEWDSSETLIVDDVYDTGLTMDALHQVLPKARKAVLLHKKKPPGWLSSVQEVPEKTWIIFPWEKYTISDVI